jgi:hypothetical protein
MGNDPVIHLGHALHTTPACVKVLGKELRTGSTSATLPHGRLTCA